MKHLTDWSRSAAPKCVWMITTLAPEPIPPALETRRDDVQREGFALPAEAQSLEDLVRCLVQAIRADPPSFDQPATLDGALRMAAVAGLLRATRLLEDALACANNEADEALLLVLRTLVEININVWGAETRIGVVTRRSIDF